MPDDEMPDPTTPDPDGIDPIDPLADDLGRRLGPYLGSVTAEPTPDELARLGPDDVRRLARRRGPRPGPAWAALAAAAVLVVALVVVGLRRPAEDGLQVGPAATAPAPRPEPAPAGTTVPSAAPGTTVVGADPTTTVAGVDPPVTIPGAGPSTSVLGPVGPTVAPPTTPPTSSAPPTSGPAPTVPGGQVLFSDDFAAAPVGPGVPAGWSSDAGSWEVAADGTTHYLKNRSGPGSTSAASAGSGTWTDYTVSATVRRGVGTVMGVAARYQGPSDHLFCKVEAGLGWLVVGTVHNGQVASLGHRDLVVPTGGTVTLRLTVQGSSVSCAADGGPSVAATSSMFAAGRVAVVADGSAGFTAVKVTT